MDPTCTTEARDRSRWDAVVIGAGPAGAMVARELAARGACVLLVERRRFPREKVCGGCLSGHALAVLRSAGLGSLAERSGGMSFSSFRLGVRGRAVQLDLPPGMAVSRARFDAELVAAAVAAGARFLPGTEARVGDVDGAARAVHLGSGHDCRLIAGSLVLVATGLGLPRLPGGSGPRPRVARDSKLGAGCFLDDGPPGYEAGAIHMAVGKAGYVGLIRLADARLHLACALEQAALQQAGGPGAVAATILAEAGFPRVPSLGTAMWRGTPALTRRTRPLADERLLILGDAAGYVEPFTGEGIAWALGSARAIAPLAARALDRWDARLGREWEILHRRVVRRRQFLCRAAAEILRRRWLTRAAFEVIARLPVPAGRLLEYYGGDEVGRAFQPDAMNLSGWKA
jgi:2-polyprenyl-6-methoxyphenol hydroxylase-like FAD-dependent oxidoreductase